MSSPPVPSEDARYLEQFVAQTQAALGRLREANRMIGEVVGTGEAAQGLVRAAADGRGVLTKVEVDPRGMRLAAGELGAEVTKAIRAAQDDARRRTGEIVDDALTRAGELPQPLDETFVRHRIEVAAHDFYSEQP
ncbi:YbaB/EbfC family nucleoid-associated protein [Nonomuraea lactucae]|uniref:YbaB/EbfC family nucleoid-associated protein n=1 Tax=Nonomuraea lactucae TaxID=2249762 RepID=UPI0013B3B560|nr:YbaB/EbfC family nucleoid-associated protein [Nonomuraea lactucae]